MMCSGLGISELLCHMKAAHSANSYRRAGSQEVWRGIEDVIVYVTLSRIALATVHFSCQTESWNECNGYFSLLIYDSLHFHDI